MKLEEFLSKLASVGTEPDKAPALLSELSEEAKSLFTSVDTLTEANKNYEKQVADLRDTNMKLFLKTTGTSPDEDPEDEEKTPETIIAEFVSEFKPEFDKE